ncbi:MAG: hypothetical protein ABSF91_08405 [Bacteroidota bacterium]
MRGERSITLIAAALVLTTSSHAQSTLRPEVLAGVSPSGLTTGVLSNWGDGWTIGGGVAYPASSAVDLALDITYSSYSYRGDNLWLVFPAIAGLRWSVSGAPSNVVEASLAARLGSSGSIINPFLSLRTGICRLNTGEIVVSTWFDSNPRNVSRSTYSGSGVQMTKGFASLSFGLAIPLNANIRVRLEGGLTQTFDLEEGFIPLLSTVQFDL